MALPLESPPYDNGPSDRGAAWGEQGLSHKCRSWGSVLPLSPNESSSARFSRGQGGGEDGARGKLGFR